MRKEHYNNEKRVLIVHRSRLFLYSNQVRGRYQKLRTIALTPKLIKLPAVIPEVR